MKTAVSIPDDVFKSAEKLARQLGISRSQLYTDAMRRYLADQANNDLTAKIDAALEGVDTRLDPTLKQARNRSLRKTLGREKW